MGTHCSCSDFFASLFNDRHQPSFFYLILPFFLWVFGATVFSIVGLYIAEIFPTIVRLSGLCLILNLGFGLLETLISYFGRIRPDLVPSSYLATLIVTTGCLLSFFCLRQTKETSFAPLAEEFRRKD